MLKVAELFAGTSFAEALETCETLDFVEPETPRGKDEKVIRDMTLLEKALFTASKRNDGEEAIAFRSALWSLVIKPSLPKDRRNKPLFIRAGFIIVEGVETPLE